MADLELLLAPIRVGAPTGGDLRHSSGDVTLNRIQEHRSEVEPEFDPSGGSGRSADWSAVVRECEEALRTKSKDLQIAAWLAEGWAHLQGFAGLRDGLILVRELSRSFWDELHPGVDDGAIDPAVRARPLSWLGSSRDMIRSLKACPIVQRDGAVLLSWQLYEFSQRVDEQSTAADRSRHDEMIASGWIGGDEWRARLRGLPLATLREAHANLDDCSAALEDLRKLSSERLPPDAAPNLIPLSDLLNAIREHLAPYLAAPLAESPAPTIPTSGAAAPREHTSGPIRSREQALRMLIEVADWYRKNEPHSPIAPLVARAARWGGMPFEQVLREVVRDEGVLMRVWEMLGTGPEGSGS